MDIKQHVLSMTPAVQNMLLCNAINTKNLGMLSELLEILREQRNPNQLARITASMMKDFTENGVASAENLEL